MVRLSLQHIILLLLMLTACVNDRNQEKEPARSADPEVPKKPASTFQDTLLVARKSALFFYPDSIQQENIRRVIGQDDYSAIMHEYEYLEKNARNVLRQYFPEIPILQAKNVRFLLFKKQYMDSLVDLDQLGDPIGLYLFMPSKDPHLVDLPNVDQALSAYFAGN